MEIWKDIKGYVGYQVSNYGRVRTYNKITHTERHGDRHWKNRILKQKDSKDKCFRVELWKDGSHKTVLVHRLVAVAFLGEPPDRNMTVNHKDGNRHNNNIENLEWLTLADNIRHGFKNGLYANVMKPIILIDDYGNEFKFISMKEACIFLGRSHSYLSNAILSNISISDKDKNKYYLK